MSPRIAVVGAGFTGLVAAYELRKRLGDTARIILLDQAGRIGGSIRGVDLGGHGAGASVAGGHGAGASVAGGLAFDAGAESFLANSADLIRLAAELGLADRVVSSSTARPRVFAAGALRPLPAGTYFGLPGPDVDKGLFEEGGLLDSADLALIREDRPVDWDEAADMSIAELVEPVYGPKVITRLVDPLLTGVYAGNARTIGVRAGLPGIAAGLDSAVKEDDFPSLGQAVRRARAAAGASGPMFRSFAGGLRVLLDALAAAAAPLELRLGEPVTGVVPVDGGYRLDLAGSHGSVVEVDAVVLAVGAPVLAVLLAEVDKAAANAAGSVLTASPVVVALRTEPLDLPQELSGALVAAGEGLSAKAFTFSMNKWPHLGEPVLRASFGRFGDDLSGVADEQLLAWAASDFTRLFNIRLAPTAWAVERYPQALPQYGPWHSRKAAAIRAASKGRLGVAGNFLQGVGLGACAATAAAAAEQVVRGLRL